MKAMVMTAPGAPEVLILQDLPLPPMPQGHDLRVRLHAVGVNPVDAKLRARGTYYPDRLPAVLGIDGAGVVEAVGADVSRYQVGDAVYFCQGGLGGPPGTYAEYVVVDERHVAPKPQSLSFVEAAAAPLVTITAWEALFDRGNLHAGQTVLIHAGAGGVGHVALQLACLHGARACTTVSDDRKAELVQTLGAEAVIRYPHTDFVAEANRWSEGGVDLALDTVGGATLVKTVQTVGYAGDLVTLLEPGADFNWKEARLRNLRLSLELMLTPLYRGLDSARQHQADILRQCARLFDMGRLRLHVSRILPLEEAAEAHRLIERGGTTGKIVLTLPGET